MTRARRAAAQQALAELRRMSDWWNYRRPAELTCNRRNAKSYLCKALVFAAHLQQAMPVLSDGDLAHYAELYSEMSSQAASLAGA